MRADPAREARVSRRTKRSMDQGSRRTAGTVKWGSRDSVGLLVNQRNAGRVARIAPGRRSAFAGESQTEIQPPADATEISRRQRAILERVITKGGGIRNQEGLHGHCVRHALPGADPLAFEPVRRSRRQGEPGETDLLTRRSLERFGRSQRSIVNGLPEVPAAGEEPCPVSKQGSTQRVFGRP